MKHLASCSQSYADICVRNLDAYFGVTASCDTPPVISRSIVTTKDLIVSIHFMGTVYGEYLLALSTTTAAELLGVDISVEQEDYREVRDEISGAFKGLLNAVVGEAILDIKEHHSKLTITSPRVFYGEVCYPQFETVKSVLNTHAGDIECYLFVDMMRLSIADSYDEATQSLQEANRMLQLANSQLRHEVEGHIETQKARDAMQQELIEASRLAGMAEFATGVIHNVGNILNSVNVSASMIRKQVDGGVFPSLERVSGFISPFKDGFREFVNRDERGPKLAGLIVKITEALKGERKQLSQEVNDLVKNIEHIKEVVYWQQEMAKSKRRHQELSPVVLLEDAITANKSVLINRSISIEIESDDQLATLVSDQHVILQILVNLIRNAADSLAEQAPSNPTILASVKSCSKTIAFEVRDNGVGIREDRVTKIFQHGFTTKKSGHGFGLHSSANAAHELGGSLSVSSDGVGKGACFRLELPYETSEECAGIAS